ncbi:MAG TPA: hypothetical protein VHP63_07160 [candidate division Zixibacteria bacterium]|nr:hypothetical protein [candidate division Zixibacteria bacterium]
MNDGLNTLKSRRIWLVPDFVVWGISGLGEIEYLDVENIDGTKSVSFGSAGIGDTSQSVAFANLTDVRGNDLPALINRPLVTARSHDQSQAFVIGTETDSGFKIARDPSAPSLVTIDLIITELGE